MWDRCSMEHLIVADDGASEGRHYVRFDAAASAGADREGHAATSTVPSPPATRRYQTLLFASLLPVGAHVCDKMTSSIEKDLLTRLGINDEQYGILNSSVSWASVACLPFMAGVFVDRIPTRFAAVLFSSFVFVGHLIFSLGVSSGSYFMAVLGRAVFGFGESTVMVAQVPISHKLCSVSKNESYFHQSARSRQPVSNVHRKNLANSWLQFSTSSVLSPGNYCKHIFNACLFSVQ